MDGTMGSRIAANRKRLGLTQDQLAEQMGVSPQAVSKWENDLSCPDISALPKLAEIFGVSTDELLGVASKEPVYEGEVVTEKAPPEDRERHINIHLHSGRLNGIFFALWVIAMGGMLMAGRLMELPFGFWTAAWTTALLVFGIRSMIREFHFFGLAAAGVGAYFIGYKLELIPVVHSWEMVWPILIVGAGLCLLIDALTEKRRKTIKIPKASKSRSSTQEGTFTFDDSFGEHTLQVDTPVLKGGDVSVSFGDHTLSLTGVKKIAPNCTISVNNSFGELRILVPRRFRAEADLSKAFANFEIHGQPAEQTEGTIFFQIDTNFGETTITYV